MLGTRPSMAGAQVLGMISMQPDARRVAMLEANISARLGRRRKMGRKICHLHMSVMGGEEETIQAPGVDVWWSLTKPPPLTQPTRTRCSPLDQRQGARRGARRGLLATHH